MNSLFFVPVVRHSFVSLYSLPTCSVFCIIFSIFLSNLKKKRRKICYFIKKSVLLQYDYIINFFRCYLN